MSPSVFVDTTAIYAHLVAEDRAHPTAASGFDALATKRARLVTTSYILLETVSLLQARIGVDAVRRFERDVAPLLEVRWVDAELHRRALSALLAAGARSVSLTDWTSFELMRAEGLDEAFSFDQDFARQGFRLFPQE